MSRTHRILPLGAFLVMLSVSPALAQHDGMHDHDGPQGGMGDHMEMGAMHNGEMMNNLDTMMNSGRAMMSTVLSR